MVYLTLKNGKAPEKRTSHAQREILSDIVINVKL